MGNAAGGAGYDTQDGTYAAGTLRPGAGGAGGTGVVREYGSRSAQGPDGGAGGAALELDADTMYGSGAIRMDGTLGGPANDAGLQLTGDFGPMSSGAGGGAGGITNAWTPTEGSQTGGAGGAPAGDPSQTQLSPDTAPLAKFYLNSCTQTAGATPATSGGSCVFHVPAGTATDTYELRLFAANGYTKLASFSPLTVDPTAPVPGGSGAPTSLSYHYTYDAAGRITSGPVAAVCGQSRCGRPGLTYV